MVYNNETCTGNVNPSTCVSNSLILALRIFKGAGSIVGTFGALMTITTIGTHKSLQTVPNAYLVNLAVADLVVCSFLLPISIYTITEKPNDIFCQLVAYPNLLCMMVSVLSLSLVAVNRYVVICKSRELYARIYTPRNTGLSILGTWLLCCIVFSPPFYGFGTYGYNDKFGVCIFIARDVETYWFVFAMADCMVMLPTFPLTLFCYVNIMLKFHRSQTKVVGIKEDSSRGQTIDECTKHSQASVEDGSVQPPGTNETSVNLQAIQKSKKRESKRQTQTVIKNMFVIWCTFLTFWMPIVIAHKLDYHGTYPKEIYHVLFCIAQCNSAVNFFIYCVLNKKFRDAYVRVVTLKVFQRGSI